MLDILREQLKKNNIDAYVISYGNRFLGQDVLAKEHKLSVVCGFTGSAGAFTITQDKAFLVVDGRYELQAKMQIDTNKINIINDSPRLKTLCDLLKEENIRKIGYDSWNYSVAEMEFIKRKYRDFEFIDVGDFVGLENDNAIEIYHRDEKFSGMSTKQKIAFITDELKEKKADYMLITSADSVSWLLNIYARDLPCSPVVRAYALISKNGEITLFGENLKTDLTIKNWSQFILTLTTLSGKVILYDPHTAPEKFKNLLNSDVLAGKCDDIAQILKVQKNPIELQGMINCHIRDGIALCKFLFWLESNFKDKTELDIVQKLHELRKEQNLFFSESFETIAGFGEHSAIVHYQPTEKSNVTLQKNNLLLIDSGGQYLDGTTDVTRTVALSEPTEDMKKDFTYVLKAHIALAKAKFPINTSGYKLDTLARAPLWEHGLEYKHGTGHGVACFGNVHEGPISISLNGSMYGLTENMITSIEPGVYKENQYGIRIENLAYIRKINEQFLEFVPLTKAPLDKKLIYADLLDADEKKWLNSYHKDVFETISPHLENEEQEWLRSACAPL